MGDEISARRARSRGPSTLKPTLLRPSSAIASSIRFASFAKIRGFMPTLIARRYDTLRPVAVEVTGGRIARLVPAADQPGLPLIAPGLVDLQVNGFAGIEFNDPELTIEKVRQVA